jgi:hypothetical protein
MLARMQEKAIKIIERQRRADIPDHGPVPRCNWISDMALGGSNSSAAVGSPKWRVVA